MLRTNFVDFYILGYSMNCPHAAVLFLSDSWSDCHHDCCFNVKINVYFAN